MIAFTYLGRNLSPEIYARVSSLCTSPFAHPAFVELQQQAHQSQWGILHRATGDVPLAFEQTGHRAVISSQLVGLSTTDVEVLARALFERLPGCTRIDLGLVTVDPRGLSLPTMLLRQSEDFVLALPETFQQYLDRLGSNTRKHAPYYIRRLRRDYRDFEFVVARAGDVTFELVEKVVALNRARMRSQGRVSGIDEAYLDRLFRFARVAGLVTAIRVEGKVIAGTICSELGGSYYLHVIAHDDDFGRLNPGQACLLLTIEECIRCRGSDFHFLWGDTEYKRRFLGERKELYAFSMYPSRARRAVDMMRSGPELLRARLLLARRQLKPLVERASPRLVEAIKRRGRSRHTS